MRKFHFHTPGKFLVRHLKKSLPYLLFFTVNLRGFQIRMSHEFLKHHPDIHPFIRSAKIKRGQRAVFCILHICRAFRKKIVRKKGVQKLSGCSERFFCRAFRKKIVRKKRSAKIKRVQRAVFCILHICRAYRKKIVRKKGVQKLSGCSERFFAYCIFAELTGKRLSEKAP